MTTRRTIDRGQPPLDLDNSPVEAGGSGTGPGTQTGGPGRAGRGTRAGAGQSGRAAQVGGPGRAGRTAYDEYVGTDVLHSLAQPHTDEPTEQAFLVISQVMELYFGLVCFEWRYAQHAVRTDQVPDAVAALRRSVQHMTALNASWQSLRGLTPGRFNRFRDRLGEASGFQSYQYRHMELLLGLKSEALIRPHHHSGPIYVELRAALHAPSLYDDVLALLDRRGYPVPASVLRRDFSAEYAPSRGDAEATERAWAAVYQAEEPDGGELWQLAEAMVDIAEQFSEWRYQHLMSVRRSMGAKPGTAGSSGLAWLERSLRRTVFPELFSARTQM